MQYFFYIFKGNCYIKAYYISGGITMYNQFYPYMMTGTLPNATRMASPLMSAVRTSPLSSLFGVRGAPAVSALGGATKASTFTFTGLLNGASKTLGVINQAIPVFYQVKPIWNNARTMFRVVKEINSKDNSDSSNNVTKQTTNSPQKKVETDNAPTFFA